MFAKLLKCCWKGSTKLPAPKKLMKNVPVEINSQNVAGKRKVNLFRRTKEEEILLLEKRYLKKYLRYYKLYVHGMTLEKMRIAKRFLEASLEPEERLVDEMASSLSQSGTQCTCFCFKSNSEAVPKSNVRRVTFQQDMVQSRYIDDYDDDAGDNSELPSVADNKVLSSFKTENLTEQLSDKSYLPTINHLYESSVGIDFDASLTDMEFDLGPFLIGSCNGPTYISFEQPEP
ncbi:uncharacterized protein LOC131689649 [Topomyia yanbarensis]|uniref:uncharacterized protein LOC131689649 n=1 Tax=Topomyia yanbarensis TaxID=2498891 RepID=UPI00273AA58B|nr:uncharacterized protein LOC131689649 [Topomyia yanbarensis]